MTRKDEIRSEIAKIEQTKQVLEQRKSELVAEAKKIKESPEEIISEILRNDGHLVYKCSHNTFMYYAVYIHLQRKNDLSTTTKKIYDETGFVLYAFEDLGDRESRIWFRKFS